MTQHEAVLETLRGAAQERDWGAAQDALTSLLMEAEFFAGLEIALKRAYDHLPTFESHHTDAGWARSLLVWIASYGAAPANLPIEASNPYPSPGAANFVKALIDLTRSVERQNPLENRVRFISSAISNVMLADLAAFWYGNHADIWEIQQAHGDEIDSNTQVSVRQSIYAQFWLDESVAERDTAAWLTIADQLAAKLNSRT
jgi:hypothetical protein